MTFDPVLTGLGLATAAGLAVVLVTEFRYQRRRANAASTAGSAMRAGLRDGSLQLVPEAPTRPLPWIPDTPTGKGNRWRAFVRRPKGDNVEFRYTERLYTTRRAAMVGAVRLADRLNDGREA